MEDLRGYTLGDEATGLWTESFRNRVKSANDASARVSYTLVFTALVSAGFTMVMFAYFSSWNKSIAEDYTQQVISGQKMTESIVRNGVIQEWISTQTYQLPMLGLSIMASDLPIFGPIVLIIVSTWLFYVVRREHYTVGRLLGDVYIINREKILKKNPAAIILCQEIYHSLIGYTILNVIPYESPIQSLNEAMIASGDLENKHTKYRFKRIIINLLVLTPVASVLFIGLTRLISFLFIKSAITGQLHTFSELSALRKIEICASTFLVSLGICICYQNAIKVIRLDKATRKLLDKFQKWAFQGVVT